VQVDPVSWEDVATGQRKRLDEATELPE